MHGGGLRFGLDCCDGLGGVICCPRIGWNCGVDVGACCACIACACAGVDAVPSVLADFVNGLLPLGGDLGGIVLSGRCSAKDSAVVVPPD